MTQEEALQILETVPYARVDRKTHYHGERFCAMGFLLFQAGFRPFKERNSAWYPPEDFTSDHLDVYIGPTDPLEGKPEQKFYDIVGEYSGSCALGLSEDFLARIVTLSDGGWQGPVVAKKMREDGWPKPDIR